MHTCKPTHRENAHKRYDLLNTQLEDRRKHTEAVQYRAEVLVILDVWILSLKGSDLIYARFTTAYHNDFKHKARFKMTYLEQQEQGVLE